jgi:hypothetical protein
MAVAINMFIAGALFSLIAVDMLRDGKIPVASILVCLANLFVAFTH